MLLLSWPPIPIFIFFLSQRYVVLHCKALRGYSNMHVINAWNAMDLEQPWTLDLGLRPQRGRLCCFCDKPVFPFSLCESLSCSLGFLRACSGVRWRSWLPSLGLTVAALHVRGHCTQVVRKTAADGQKRKSRGVQEAEPNVTDLGGLPGAVLVTEGHREAGDTGATPRRQLSHPAAPHPCRGVTVTRRVFIYARWDLEREG